MRVREKTIDEKRNREQARERAKIHRIQQKLETANSKQLECSELELRMVLEIGFFMQMHQFKICIMAKKRDTAGYGAGIQEYNSICTER